VCLRDTLQVSVYLAGFSAVRAGLSASVSATVHRTVRRHQHILVVKTTGPVARIATGSSHSNTTPLLHPRHRHRAVVIISGSSTLTLSGVLATPVGRSMRFSPSLHSICSPPFILITSLFENSSKTSRAV